MDGRVWAGQQVSVCYLPGNPAELELDEFWPRHYGSVLALGVCTILALRGALDFAERHRRRVNALLREDYVDSRINTQRMPLLPIDLAPPLWDHELDGVDRPDRRKRPIEPGIDPRTPK